MLIPVHVLLPMKVEMEKWLTKIQVPHCYWHDGPPELAPDKVGPGVHVRPSQDKWRP